ncbi:hypothetical protein PAMC26510_06485 [Caballeronia sordidicola]|uniref:Uncharacterized protein n=1 Tax=Caballeronia sordidicola TaxID=196367 RepID=A0A242MJT7_CABSO|nr:hypothetical protein PAMC26577_24245 [Caballeronia sordidicola]OTP79105.1 hypothetical protein PAMC26510_06485 [Caballeronia sordidicola]
MTGNGWFIAMASKERRDFARAAADDAGRFQERSLVQTASWNAELCIKRGWNAAPRDEI